MLKEVSVLIPYKPDNGMRDQSFAWVKRFHEVVMPDVELCIGEDQSSPFNRSAAINAAAKKSTRNVLVIADGDIIYDPQILIQAHRLLDKHPWVIPYGKWWNISTSSTQILLNSNPKWPLPQDLEVKSRYKRFKPVSGLIVLPRRNYDIVEGFDERFQGWGGEDLAFNVAMNTLCGKYKRIENNSIYHLWHPFTGAKGNPFHKNNETLYKSYLRRKRNKQAMAKFVGNPDRFISG